MEKRHLFNIFKQRRRSSASSDNHELEEDTSDDDKSIDLASYQAAVAPLCFKHFKSKKDGIDLSERLQLMLDDEDYEKYLRQPKHIKTFCKSHKSAPICKRLFLAQELKQDMTTLSPSDLLQMDDPSLSDIDLKEDKKNSIWAMKFSQDGKFLASAGKGNVIRIWKVISSPLDRLDSSDHDDDDTVSIDQEDKSMAYASVFQDQPYRSFYGHCHDILSLDWSKNNFLLSSSMDKTVRLWNSQQTKCLRTFQHRDFVPSVKFHPTDDRFFISGCLDHKVRLWSILENEAKYEFDAGNLVTAVAFTPNGSLTIAGTFSGMVYFLDTQSLELRHSLELNKKHENMKITGIECFNDGDDIKVVISSNDSRIRFISLKYKQMEYYFKGLDNNSSQIIATVSDDNRYIISGSENHWLYVWQVNKDKKQKSQSQSTNGLLSLISKKKRRADYTSFHAHHHIITCALIAPSGTFKALSLSNDYIYELNSELNDVGMFDETALVDNEIGGIIVTADDHGLIRVFRQDLPSSVRKTLLREKKSREHEVDSHRTSLLNKALNGSTNSLSRGNSQRSVPIIPSPAQGRSRSGTMDSRLQKKFTCDVCGGDKFAVSKMGNGLEMSCTDCGNQIKT